MAVPTLFLPANAACVAVTVAVPAAMGVIAPVVALIVATPVLTLWLPMAYVIAPPVGIEEVATFMQLAEHESADGVAKVSVGEGSTGVGLSFLHELIVKRKPIAHKTSAF